jgi:Ribonuclease G/E
MGKEPGQITEENNITISEIRDYYKQKQDKIAIPTESGFHNFTLSTLTFEFSN